MTCTVGQNGIVTFLLILDTFLCIALHVAATLTVTVRACWYLCKMLYTGHMHLSNSSI